MPSLMETALWRSPSFDSQGTQSPIVKSMAFPSIRAIKDVRTANLDSLEEALRRLHRIGNRPARHWLSSPDDIEFDNLRNIGR